MCAITCACARGPINGKKYSAKYIYLIVTWLSDTKVSKYTFGFAHLLGHGCFLVL